eukprot:SAG31_NODE_2995_length_4804_cov_9.959192_4_plen_93_part_00
MPLPQQGADDHAFGSLKFRMAALAGNARAVDKQILRARNHLGQREGLFRKFLDSTALTAAELQQLEQSNSVSKELIGGGGALRSSSRLLEAT